MSLIITVLALAFSAVNRWQWLFEVAVSVAAVLSDLILALAYVVIRIYLAVSEGRKLRALDEEYQQLIKNRRA